MNDTQHNRGYGNSPNDNGWQAPPPVASDEKLIDLREIVLFLRAGKWIIAAFTAAILALALTYAFLATPIYEANALIQVEQGRGRPSGAAGDLIALLAPTASPSQTEIAIIKSRAVLVPTIEKENLNIVIGGGGWFDSLGFDKSKVVIEELAVPDAWMDEKLRITVNGNERYTLASPSGEGILRGQVGKPAVSSDGAVKILVSRLEVPAGTEFPVVRIYNQEALDQLKENFVATEKAQDSGILSLTLQGTDPVRIKSILNTLANQYIQQNVMAMAQQARKSLAFINDQLPQIKQQLDEAQTRLTEYKTTKGVVNLDRQAQELLSALTSLGSQLTQLQLTQSAMQQRFTGSFPGLQGLRQQQQDIRQKIDSIHAQIELLPAKEQDYVDLLQKVQIYQQLYTTLLSKSQDLQIVQAGTVGSARVVDYAIKPIEPVKPKKSLLGVLGLLIGLFAGILFVFLRRALVRSVQNAAQLEEEFGIPVFAIVPHSKKQGQLAKRAKQKRKIGLLAIEDPRDPAVEALRSFTTSINVALLESQSRIISLGGCTPDVGKSFLSVNLAHVMGMSGARVLVVDADLRRGHLEKYMATHKRPGLADLLRGEIELEKTIQRAPRHENVDFIPSGAYPTNPYDLVAGRQFAEIMTKCADEYDLVVIDLPPVLSVAEGVVIARFATANFLVVKAGVQRMEELRVALDRLQQNGVRLKGFIFNDLTRVAQTYTYGRYSEGYYYAGYASETRK